MEVALLSVGGLALLAPSWPLVAFESHVVNVVSRLEIPLQVTPATVDIDSDGEARVTVELSPDFLAQARLQGVDYRLSLDADIPVGDASDPAAGSVQSIRCERDLSESDEPQDRMSLASLGRYPADTSDVWVLWLEFAPAVAGGSEAATVAPLASSLATGADEPSDGPVPEPSTQESLSTCRVTVQVEIVEYLPAGAGGGGS